jgi:outer membrane receptor protein involved in Fe transport
MRTLLPAAAVAAAVAASTGQAQQTVTVSGQVTAGNNGQPLPAVQVFIPSLSVGGQTREDGRFTFTVPARAAGTTVTVTARRIGYRSATQQVALRGGSATVTFALEAAATQLTGVVVSALSVQREKATIGTSQQQLTTREINTTKDPNIVNALSGKVAGVQINAGGNIGGSSRIVIRGNNSINGDNQPLFIVDGTPVSNANVTNSTQAAGNGGIDYGKRDPGPQPRRHRQPDGPQGPERGGALRVARRERRHRHHDEERPHGGAGGAGDGQLVHHVRDADAPAQLPERLRPGLGRAVQVRRRRRWGRPGRQRPELRAAARRASDRPVHRQAAALGRAAEQRRDFFNLGRTFQNNVAISATTTSASARLSFGNQQQAGIIPSSRLNRTTAVINGDVRVGERLNTTANVQYVRNQGFNRPGTGYTGGILEQFIWFGRQVDTRALAARRYNEDGTLFNWNSNYHNNPYWLLYDNPNRDQRDRVIGSAQAQYRAASWLTGTLRSGIDSYRENRELNYAAGNLQAIINGFGGVDPNYAGAFDFTNRRESEFNTDGFLTAVGSRGVFDFNVLAGGNIRRNQINQDQTSTSGISVPGIYNVSNAAVTPILTQNLQRRGINSVYSQASVTVNKVWTVDVTGRNDWSSTLPRETNSYFYPSVSTSLVVSDLLPAIQTNGLDFLKLRGSIAQVGADAAPYQLQSVYTGQATKFGSLPQFTLGNTIANANLRPERTTSSEGGLEFGLFDNRLTFDGTYYNRRTDNQIITLPISNTTGFANRAINAGRVTNKGVEALVTAIPVRTAGGFTWTSTINFTRNRNKIVTLAPGLSTVILGSAWGLNVEAREGQQFGTLFGAGFLRDSATGQVLINGGLPEADPTLKVLGNYNPDWVGGWNNEFRLKRFVVSGLIDVRRGGDIFSVSNMFGNYTGVFNNTLQGREVDWNNPGIVARGIDAETGAANATNVTSEAYFQSLYGIHEAFVYDGSFVKLRELRVGYDLPQSFLGRARVRSANISLVGRNLLMRSRIPNVDPETALSTSNAQGLEFASIPTARSFGFNITFTP